MANAYGFDFLRSEHIDKKVRESDDDDDDDVDNEPIGKMGSNRATADSGSKERPKSDLEKQFVVLQFLQENRTSGRMFTPSQIYEAVGIDLAVDGEDSNCAAMLARNPKVKVDEVLNPDYNEDVDDDSKKVLLTYGYQAKFNINEKAGLLAQVNRCKNGIRAKELYDAYDGAEEDINDLVTGGEVLAVANPEDKDRTLFPRGEPFLVELEGNVTVPELPEVLKKDSSSNSKKFKSKVKNKNNVTIRNLIPDYKVSLTESEKRDLLKEHSHFVSTEVDARQQMRRGEAIWVGGKWYRISSAIRRDLPLSEQPPRAQAPPSVTLHKDLSKKNEVEGYVRPFERGIIPLDHQLSEEARANLTKAKDLRDKLNKLTTQVKTSMKAPGGARMISNHNQREISGMTSSAIRKRPTKHLNAAAARRSVGIASAHSSLGDIKSSKVGPTSAGNAANDEGGDSNEVDAKVLIEQIREIQSDPTLHSFSQARRHGCTADIKKMYLETIEDVPEDEIDLYKLMIKHKLLEEHEPIRRPRMSKTSSQDGQKPKKRRYYERKNQRITNTHLIGTEMGSILAAAQVAAAQGKDVGNEGV